MGSGPVVRFHDRGVLNPQCTNLLCKVKAEMHCEIIQLGSEASTNGRQVQPLALEVQLQNILCSLHLLLQVTPGLCSQEQVGLSIFQHLVREGIEKG